jgi:hypothetical protein
MEGKNKDAAGDDAVICPACGRVTQLDPATRKRLIRDLKDWDRRTDLPDAVLDQMLDRLGYRSG